MSCAHEHEHGGHDGHGHDDHHGHSHEVPLSSGPSDSLFPVIDVPNVVTLNASGGGDQGRVVIKEWAERENEDKWLESDTDDSLIIQIPFTASVSLRSITLKAGPGGFTPSEMRVFVNAKGIDFSDAEDRAATQVFNIVETREGAEYQVKASKFSSTTSLALYFPHNVSEGTVERTTRIFYIGLRGSWKPLPGRPVAFVYEAIARPTDHKVEGVYDAAASSRPGY